MLSNDQFTAYAEQYMDTVYRVALHDLKSPSHAEDYPECISQAAERKEAL